MTNLYIVNLSAHFSDDLIAFIALTIEVCRGSMDISLWVNLPILSDNQNRIIIREIAAVNQDGFPKVIDIRVVNLSA